jgi:probable F420-dependent oxidoreductase
MDARNLHDLSDGRFHLGLGTQVRAHIVRRFSTAFDPPGPRFREYVESIKAIWNTWDNGEPLDYQGTYYSFSLMTPEFEPGPNKFGPIALELAAVNPYNLETAGRLAEGVRVHPFCTGPYLRDTILPKIVAAAEQAGRTRADIEVMGGGFVATGPNEEVVTKAREAIRDRVAWYASTPSYRPVLEMHGWVDVHEKARALVRAKQWHELAAVVPDEVLDAFCVAGTYRELPRLVQERFGGLTDTIGISLGSDRADDDEIASMITELKTGS